ncbi:MAG: hypothetical protein ABIL09_27925 [Gemmatimonadota bacterium]
MLIKILGGILLLIGLALAARMLFGIITVLVSLLAVALLIYYGLRLLKR